MTDNMKDLVEVDSEQTVEEIAEEFETVFDLADVIRLHKGICYGGFEDAIMSYGLSVEEAAATFLPPLFREEIVEEFIQAQAESEKTDG